MHAVGLGAGAELGPLDVVRRGRVRHILQRRLCRIALYPQLAHPLQQRVDPGQRRIQTLLPGIDRRKRIPHLKGEVRGAVGLIMPGNTERGAAHQRVLG